MRWAYSAATRSYPAAVDAADGGEGTLSGGTTITPSPVDARYGSHHSPVGVASPRSRERQYSTKSFIPASSTLMRGPLPPASSPIRRSPHRGSRHSPTVHPGTETAL